MTENTAREKEPEKEKQDAGNMRMNALVTASLVLEEIGSLNRLKVQTKGEARVAESELKVAQSYVGSNIEGKVRAVSDANSKVSSIESRQNQKLDEAQEGAGKLSEASKKVQEATQKTDEEKSKEEKERTAVNKDDVLMDQRQSVDIQR